MPAEINVAIIGLGGKGRSHAVNLANVPQVRIAALCDINPDAIAKCRRQLGAPGAEAYGTNDPDRIFSDAKIDAVVIATQHDTHSVLAIAAAQARKHLLVEKPLALTIEECLDIENAVTAAGTHLFMGFQARHRSFVQMIKQRIPHPRVLVGEIIDPKWPDEFWAVDPIKGGGNVLSQGVHTFDLVSYLAGSEPISVYAQGGVLSHDAAVTPTIDTCLATIQFANGAVANTVIGDFGPLPWPGDKAFYQVFDAGDHSATMYGTTLLFASGAFGGKTEIEEHRVDQQYSGDPANYEGTVGLVTEFVQCVREDRQPTISGTARDGRRATTMALRAFESMRMGQPQTI